MRLAAPMLLLLACGSNEWRRPNAGPSPTGLDVTPPGMPVPRQPVRVARSGAPAPLLTGTITEAQAAKTFESNTTSQGFARTLFVTTRGLFVLDASHLVGPLAASPGGPLIFGGLVGEDDGVVGVSADGRVWFAKSADAAMKTASYDGRGQVGSPLAFDTANDVVAVAAADAIFVSLDAGRSFERVALPGKEPPFEIFARADGVVVVGTGTAARPTWYVGSKAGPLSRSSYQPASIYRRGAVIASQSGCDAALAVDGRTWFAPDWKTSKPRSKVAPGDEHLALVPDDVPYRDPLGIGAYDSLYLHLDTALAIRPQDTLTTPRLPAAPPRPAAAFVARGADRVCDGDFASVFGMLGGGTPCRGAGCLATVTLARAPRTRRETLVFNDGRCAAADVVQKPIGDEDETIPVCRVGALPQRTPTLARVDHDQKTVRTIAIPRDCRLVHFVRAGALAWIGCADKDATRIHAVTDDDRFVAEAGAVPRDLDVRGVHAGPDGTVVVEGDDGRTAVRAPATATSEARWFVLAADTKVHVALGEGRVLVARVTSLTADEATIGIASPGGFAPLAPAIRPPGPSTKLILAEDGRIEIEIDPDAVNPASVFDSSSGKRKSRVVLMTDGTLEPVRSPTR